MSSTAPQRPTLLQRLDAGPVICAEGYVFELERRGYLQAGAFVPEVVLEHPEVVAQLHRDFVHAGSDVVEIELYDRAGRRLPPPEGKSTAGKNRGGVIQMPELTPGDYLLALRSPAGAAPVRARPALAGLVLPDTGPPADVIRKYLEEAGAEEAPESVPGSQP